MLVLAYRKTPNKKSKPIDIAAERTSEPRHPSRFEKKKNIKRALEPTCIGSPDCLATHNVLHRSIYQTGFVFAFLTVEIIVRVVRFGRGKVRPRTKGVPFFDYSPAYGTTILPPRAERAYRVGCCHAEHEAPQGFAGFVAERGENGSHTNGLKEPKSSKLSNPPVPSRKTAIT